MHRNIRKVACLIPLLVMQTTAYGDYIYFKNGDRLTGEIHDIWDNEVIIELEADDDVKASISLDLIDYMESERKFEVILRDGRKVIAELAGRGPDGKQRVVIDGNATLVDLGQLEELDEIEDYFDWESHIDFSLSLNKGNTDALNTRFFADTNVKLGDHRHIAALTLSREEQNQVTTKDQSLVQYNYNWVFSDPWFFGIAASGERDPIRNLDRRVILGATSGRDIFNKPRLFLNFQFGLGYLTEEDTAGDENDSTALLWALRYRQDFFSKDLELYHDNLLNVYVTGRTNTVVKTVTGLRYELTDILYFNTTIDYDYESDPLEGAENDDLTFVVGLGTEF